MLPWFYCVICFIAGALVAFTLVGLLGGNRTSSEMTEEERQIKEDWKNQQKGY